MMPLVVERSGHTTRLTLNRPEQANALDAATVEALLTAVERSFVDGTRMLVIAAAGPHFCGGFDFTGIETQSEGDLLLRFVRIEQLLQAVWHAPIATVALAIPMMLLTGLFVKMANGATYAVVPFVHRGNLGAVAGIVGAGGNVGAVAAGYLFRAPTSEWPAVLQTLGIAVAVCAVLTLAMTLRERESATATEGALADAAAPSA